MCCSTFIKKMKSRRVEHQLAVGFVVSTKEHGGAKNSLETFDKPAISLAVFEQAEKVEDVGGGSETDDPAALANGQGGHPDWNEAVLTVGQSELGMAKDLKEEFSISSGVKQLISRKSAEGKSAKDKGKSVEGEFLPSLVALFSDEVERLKFPETVFGNIDLRKERVDPHET